MQTLSTIRTAANYTLIRPSSPNFAIILWRLQRVPISLRKYMHDDSRCYQTRRNATERVKTGRPSLAFRGIGTRIETVTQE